MIQIDKYRSETCDDCCTMTTSRARERLTKWADCMSDAGLPAGASNYIFKALEMASRSSFLCLIKISDLGAVDKTNLETQKYLPYHILYV
jgi:hypothetical protein